jgi:hypothetical protein
MFLKKENPVPSAYTPAECRFLNKGLSVTSIRRFQRLSCIRKDITEVNLTLNWRDKTRLGRRMAYTAKQHWSSL